jgi:hypothetical protein
MVYITYVTFLTYINFINAFDTHKYIIAAGIVTYCNSVIK